ncbi:hypothetical protein [Streptomyces sp. NPDC056165]|uniref:hypothetical protein n=1 Tax=Streptomyces sp. NPDC056165 TaxID=3345733 RepID=UPI0035DAB17E
MIDPAHYPGHPQEMDGSPRPPRPKPADEAESAFLALGPGAKSWLIEAAAAGTTLMRMKMAAAVELAALVGPRSTSRWDWLRRPAASPTRT